MTAGCFTFPCYSRKGETRNVIQQFYTSAHTDGIREPHYHPHSLHCHLRSGFFHRLDVKAVIKVHVRVEYMRHTRLPNSGKDGGMKRRIEMNGLIGSWVEKLHALMLLNMTEENLRGVILVPAFRPQLSMVQGALRSSSPFMCWSIQEKASGFNQTSLTRLISQCFSKIVSEHESVLMVHLSEIWDEVSHDASTERFAAKPEPAARR